MTHVLDLSGSYEAMFNLRHLAVGSYPYCERERLHQGEEDYTPEDWESYYDHLHFIVSRTLINAAIYNRVFHDRLLDQYEINELQEAEADFWPVDADAIAVVLEGEVEISLREVCNKIIHSQTFELHIENCGEFSADDAFSFWTGSISVCGYKGKSKWRVQVNILAFCDLIDAFTETYCNDVAWR